MSRKPNKRGTKKRLDKLWGRIIRARANHKCEMCGKPGDQPHHIVGRRNMRLRFDLRNGINLCYGCHTRRTNCVHEDPVGLENWMLDNKQCDWDYLSTVRMEIKKWTLEEYLELVDKFKKILDEYKEAY